MAKSKSFFGLRRGSTKSMTFQVLNGQQITKDRVVDVKNPRTNAQMVQRMIMTTAGAAYNAMREIVDHSFEGYSYGQSCMSRFMSLNVHDMVEDVRGDLGQFSYNPFGDSRLYASPFIMSEGSLKFNQNLARFGGGTQTVEIILDYPSGITGSSTAQQLLDALGLRIGDMLTFPFIFSNDETGPWKFSFVRCAVKAIPNNTLSNLSLDDIFDSKAPLAILDKRLESGYLEITVEVTDNLGEESFGTVILSRKSNNAWKRSKSWIIFPGSPVNQPTAAEALATYPIGTDYILNGANVPGGGGIAPTPPPSLLPDGIYGSAVSGNLVFEVSGVNVAPLIRTRITTDLSEWWYVKDEEGVYSLGVNTIPGDLPQERVDFIQNILNEYGGADNYILDLSGDIKSDLTIEDVQLL